MLPGPLSCAPRLDLWNFFHQVILICFLLWCLFKILKSPFCFVLETVVTSSSQSATKTFLNVSAFTIGLLTKFVLSTLAACWMKGEWYFSGCVGSLGKLPTLCWRFIRNLGWIFGSKPWHISLWLTIKLSKHLLMTVRGKILL